jgi:hypothetical protein
MFKAVGAFVVGVGFIVAAITSSQFTLEFIRASIVVPGRVVRLNAGGYHPQIEFMTKTGELVSYPQGGVITRMAVGEQIGVRYLPDNPGRSATINAFVATWDMTIVFGFMGAVAILCGLLSLPSRNSQ